MLRQTAYIGLGANLVTPAVQVRKAMDAIAGLEGVQMLACSPLYRSAPMGPAGQSEYCNAACAVSMDIGAAALLEALLAIERQLGRVRGGPRWSARQIDLDLLHVVGLQLRTPLLNLPHPGLAQRNFVLRPLADIAPELEIPGLGVVGLLAERAGNAGLRLWDEADAEPVT